MTLIDKVLAQFSYGLYIITANDGVKDCGCVVNTLSQVTVKNPLVSFTINKHNYTLKAIEKTKRFGVCVMSTQGDPKAIGKFGFYTSKEVDKFEDFSTIKKWGLPFILNKCCGYLCCEAVKFIDAKTHVIVLAQTKEAISMNNYTPLTYAYYHEKLKGRASKYAPTYNSNFLVKEGNKMAENTTYVCTVCGYVYEGDITKEPDDYVCPICGVGKEAFEKQEG